MRNLLVAYFIMTTLASHALATQGDNAEEFRVLCQLIHLAEEKIPDLPKELKTTSPDAGVEKVYILSNLTGLNESQKETKLAELPATLKSWLTTIEPEGWAGPSRLAGSQVRMLRQEAETLESTINSARGKFEKARNQAQKLLAQALYGTLISQNRADEIQKVIESPTSLLKGVEAKNAVFVATDAAANSCGGAENGLKEAGKTLVNDFFCVCVSDNTGKDDKVCHEGVTFGQAWGQTADRATDFPESWTTVKQQCPKSHLAVSPETITATLSTFRGLFGRAIHNANMAKQQVLGKAHGDLASNPCGGGTAKTCVFYKQALAGAGIQWENHFLQAKRQLEEMLAERTRLEGLMRDQRHLSMITDMITRQLSHYPSGWNTTKGTDKQTKGGYPARNDQVPDEKLAGPIQNSTVSYTKLSIFTAAVICILN